MRDLMFQSLTRDSNHSNSARWWSKGRLTCFNPSRGIAIIQTPALGDASSSRRSFQSLTRDSNHSNRGDDGECCKCCKFQSLTRDSNHSNHASDRAFALEIGFNPSRGIAIIQTRAQVLRISPPAGVSIPHAG